MTHIFPITDNPLALQQFKVCSICFNLGLKIQIKQSI